MVFMITRCIIRRTSITKSIDPMTDVRTSFILRLSDTDGDHHEHVHDHVGVHLANCEFNTTNMPLTQCSLV
jgi:hypothetical protein